MLHVFKTRKPTIQMVNTKGPVVGDRLIYRHSDSAHVTGAFMARDGLGHAYANHVAVGIWGDEPPIPD